jgi:S-adenosylhomocysteine hydrolase
MPNPFDLTDRVAIVTGGGRGIGREIARVLAGAGAHVAIADIDGMTAADAATEIGSLGRRSVGIMTDVADPASAGAMASQVLVTGAAKGIGRWWRRWRSLRRRSSFPGMDVTRDG